MLHASNALTPQYTVSANNAVVAVGVGGTGVAVGVGVWVIWGVVLGVGVGVGVGWSINEQSVIEVIDPVVPETVTI